jgi:hypothetical protein
MVIVKEWLHRQSMMVSLRALVCRTVGADLVVPKVLTRVVLSGQIGRVESRLWANARSPVL